MIWLTWRQFRTQTLAVVAFLAALTVYLLITGTQLRHSYTADLAACQPQNDCFGTLNGLQSQYNGPQQLIEMLVMVAPALIGVFWGAPLIAGELERGTHLLVWNQSVTRTRWLAVKLTGIALASVLTAGVLALLATWWANPLDTMAGNRFGTRAFNTHDIAPLGYAAFAFPLGVAAGLLIRRIVPAMAATLAIFVAVQFILTAGVRPHLLPATTQTVAVDQSTMSQPMRFDRSDPVTHHATAELPAPAGAWVRSRTPILTSSGQPVPDSVIANCWDQIANAGSTSTSKGAAPGLGPFGACLAPENLHVDVTYQPASRYWPLQWIETAVYTALAALLAAVCFWRVGRLRG